MDSGTWHVYSGTMHKVITIDPRHEGDHRNPALVAVMKEMMADQTLSRLGAFVAMTQRCDLDRETICEADDGVWFASVDELMNKALSLRLVCVGNVRPNEQN